MKHAELPPQPVAEETVRAAHRAVEQADYLDTEQSIQQACEKCAGNHALGLDTEFVRERTFYARPGLIQVSDGRQVWLIDVVAVPRPEALGALLAAEDTVKILHSVGEDLEILHTVGGRWPKPLFDTQVAAAMLGLPLQQRYEHLVKAVLGVELDGGKARNDWCKRPLARDLLHYAAEDVIWLPRLKERLEELLDRAGRLEWHREDCARIVERARAGDNAPTLGRVKGAARLETPDLARLQALADWREEIARERDLPRRFVMADDKLTELAQASAGQLDNLIRKLPGGQRRRFGPAIEERLANVDGTDFERPEWIEPLSPEDRDRVAVAQKAVRSIAEELAIEPAVIASKKELTRLVRGERPDWLDGWRGRFLAGRLEDASVSISAP
ncbi:MAG: HRDC domain-containing protein [Wenzhouxiangella sp.]|nr:HRDC domain-containing protein [Wenzhouxiangella sp.]